MTRRLLARSFRPEEREVVESTLGDLLAHYKANAEEAPLAGAEDSGQHEAFFDQDEA